MPNTWNEADHPRDEDGKFTYKNGGDLNTDSNLTLYGGVEFNNEKENRENILYKDSSLKDKLSNYRDKLVGFLSDNLDRAEILFSTVAELENKILEKNISTIKETRENLVNSINNLSKNISKFDTGFYNLVSKAQNTYKKLGDLEKQTGNMYKINLEKGQNGFGEEALSSVLRYKKALDKDCNEIIMTVRNMTNQKKQNCK